MAIQTLSIKTSGGDATTLAGAEALISNGTDTWILQYDEAMTDTTMAVINYAITSGSITVTVAEAYRHNGTTTHSGTVLEGSGGYAILVQTKNVTLEYLHLRNNSNVLYMGYAACENFVGHHLVIDHNAAAAGYTVYGTGMTSGKLEQCLIYDAGHASSWVCRAYNLDVINCVSYRGGGGGSQHYFSEGLSSLRVMNCAAITVGAGTVYAAGVTAIGTGCNASSDSSAPGSTAYRSFDGSQFADLSGGDPHWDNAATAANYPGADASAYMTGDTADIDGDERYASVWDIGCDQIRVPAAGGDDGGPLMLALQLGF